MPSIVIKTLNILNKLYYTEQTYHVHVLIITSLRLLWKIILNVRSRKQEYSRDLIIITFTFTFDFYKMVK